jgi:hypothetical protein
MDEIWSKVTLYATIVVFGAPELLANVYEGKKFSDRKAVAKTVSRRLVA